MEFCSKCGEQIDSLEPSFKLGYGFMHYKDFIDDDYCRLTDYYVYTMLPFGRILRDVSPFAKGNLLDNPSRIIEKATGFPYGDLTRFKNNIEDEEFYHPRRF